MAGGQSRGHSRFGNDLRRDQRQIRSGLSKRGVRAIKNAIPHSSSKIVNDGSTSDDDKLGAIGDINFVVTHENLSESNLLIAAGDNLFTNSLADFVANARNTEVTVAVYDVGDTEAIKKYGNVTVDAEGTITRFEEKPKKPQGTLAAIALYYYSPAVLSLLRTYLAAGNNADQPGRFVQMAVHPQTSEDLPDQRSMARHRKQRDARECGPHPGFGSLKR